MRGSDLLLGFKVLFLVSFLGVANIINEVITESDDDTVYIVYMGASSPKSALRNDHAQLMTELLNRKKKSVVHTYNKSFVGFAARLSEEEAKSIAQRQGVLSVFPDGVSSLHTTRSWDFLMSQSSAFRKDFTAPTSSHISFSAGADTIIGFIDSGIYPEHPSFDDKYMGPIPSHWKGVCMAGENSTSFICNKKVIGARYYDDYTVPGDITTARDGHGHGTHVASIAAGVPVGRASYYGLAEGTARGGAPGSRIAVYRACGSAGCLISSILKAFDDAIADGVDVISLSLGYPKFKGSEDFLNNVNAIGSFHAVESRITVVASAGNSGPFPGTVENVAPWILNVAATTIDRDFETDIVLGANKVIKGGSINFSGLKKYATYPLVDGRTASSNQHDVFNASNCVPGSLDGSKVKGKIIVCEISDYDYETEKNFDILKRQLGVIGMIGISNTLVDAALKQGASPIAMVTEKDGAQIRYYIKSTSNPVATILPTTMIPHYKPAPVVAIFSSRGPTPSIENLIRPDIAAPGENILAAWRPNDTSEGIPGKEPPLFTIMTGTSMSCPHVSGVAATVKSQHPTWSPSAIKSAIMTTAISTSNIYSPITIDNGSRATPYDIGSGEINVFGPLCPGLVYEMETIDYLQFLCNYGYNTSEIETIASTLPKNFYCPSNSGPDLISDMNYPSISVSGLMPNGIRTVKRTVTNVGEEYSTYYASVETPVGVQVQVVPKILRFTKNVKKLSFQVNFLLTRTSKKPLFGSFTWSNGKYKVRSPIAVSNTMEKSK